MTERVRGVPHEKNVGLVVFLDSSGCVVGHWRINAQKNVGIFMWKEEPLQSEGNLPTLKNEGIFMWEEETSENFSALSHIKVPSLCVCHPNIPISHPNASLAILAFLVTFITDDKRLHISEWIFMWVEEIRQQSLQSEEILLTFKILRGF